MAYYKDININFETQNNGDIKTDENENAIINSIENILTTKQGTRRMLPNFANNINNLLFEPIDEITASYIKDIMIDAIYQWDDRVKIISIKVDPQYDQNKYYVKMVFSVSNIGEMTYSKELLKH